jgi:methylated-DNA-[protein]-cysteine S-methyltransferase
MTVEENKYACGELEFQLEEYFSGKRSSFGVEIRLDGTGFQKTVWSRLMKIGFGETMTYSEVARKIGRRDAARAVGNAVAANPVVLLVPCHRVVPASGGLGSYARRSLDESEGRRVKRLLLELEAGQGILTE